MEELGHNITNVSSSSSYNMPYRRLLRIDGSQFGENDCTGIWCAK
jgi:hypothetical protein